MVVKKKGSANCLNHTIYAFIAISSHTTCNVARVAYETIDDFLNLLLVHRGRAIARYPDSERYL